MTKDQNVICLPTTPHLIYYRLQTCYFPHKALEASHNVSNMHQWDALDDIIPRITNTAPHVSCKETQRAIDSYKPRYPLYLRFQAFDKSGIFGIGAEIHCTRRASMVSTGFDRKIQMSIDQWQLWSSLNLADPKDKRLLKSSPAAAGFHCHGYYADVTAASVSASEATAGSVSAMAYSY